MVLVIFVYAPVVRCLGRHCRTAGSEINQQKKNKVFSKNMKLWTSRSDLHPSIKYPFRSTFQIVPARRNKSAHSVERDSWHCNKVQRTAKPTEAHRRCFVIHSTVKPAVWSVDRSYEWHYRCDNTLWLPATWKHNILYNLSEGLETRLYLLVLTASLRGRYTTRPRCIIN
jgi:hypothetical protein